MQKAGIFPDVKTGQGGLIRAFNSAVMRPAAAGLDAFNRGIGALIGAGQEAAKQTGVETGHPELGQSAAEMIDYAAMGEPGVVHFPGMTKGQLLAEHPLHPLAGAVPDLATARDMGIMGQPEAVWKGTAEPVAANENGVKAQVAEAQDTAKDAPGQPEAAPAAEPLGEPAPAVAAEPTDVHGLARAIAPETFAEYDPLAAHQADLRQQIADAQGDLQKGFEDQAPHAAEIADLEARMQDTTPRLAKKYQARLDAMVPERDAFLADEDKQALVTRDTPEIMAMRQQLLETDFRMRDLAPDVSDAYRQAAEQMPAEEEPTAPPAEQGEPEGGTPEEQSAQVTEPAQEETPASETNEQGERARTQQPVPDIAADVSAKLQAAGRPREEADASGQVSKALWETRAAAFEGQKGTAEEMYAREAPEIRGERVKGRAMELAQKGRDLQQVRLPWMREPSLSPAYRYEGKIYRGGESHSEVLASMPEEMRAPADAVPMGSGFVNERGQFLTRTQAQDYAVKHDLYSSRAPEWAKQGDALVSHYLKTERELAQGAQGKIRLTQDGRSVITLMRTANASTFLHETGHDWLERMMRDATDPDAPSAMKADAKTVRDYLGVGEGEQIPTRGHEKFARSFERYFMEGRAPTKALAGVFGKFKDWLTTIYSTVAKLRAPITPDIRDVFDRLLTNEPDRQPAIVSEQAAEQSLPPEPRVNIQKEGQQVTGSLADLHEADLKETEPRDAANVAGHVRTEIDQTVEAHAPEVADEFASGERSASGVGGDATQIGDLGADGESASGPGESGGVSEPGPVNEGRAGSEGNGPDIRAGAEAIRAGNDGRPADGDRPAGASDAASPNRPFGRTDGDLIDKAGNIRLDNLNQPEDVNQVIREAAAANNDFIDARRGVISDQQVLDLADALGMKAADLDTRKIGQAFNAEQVVAARKLLIQSAQDVRDAAAKAATGSDADVMAYAEAAARHRMIQEQVSGITAEAGRALRAFRAIGEEGQQAKALGDFLQAQTGRTLNQMRREAQAATLLDTPQQISKFVQDSAKPTFGDMAMEYWVNGLISGPATHTTYAIGNAMLAMWKAGPETGVAAAVGKLLGSDDRVRMGEVGAGLYALVKGQRDGIRAAWKAAKTGLTTELPGEGEAGAQTSMLAAVPRPGGAIPDPVVAGIKLPIGTVTRLPSRGVATIHSYFRSIGYEQGIAQMAYRQAASEGLAGDAFAARVADLTTNPPAEMMAEARAQATDQTMMNGGGEFTRAVSDLTNKKLLGIPILKIIDPFVKIGSNVMTQALLERSPIGVLDPDIRANLMGRNGTIARDTQIARIAVGSTLGTTFVGLTAQGLVTGGGPSDPKEAAVWRLTGRQPYSVNIGGTWYSYHRLGPLAMIAGVAADMYEFGHAMETKDISHLGGLLVGSLAKNMMNESFMRGPADLVQAVEDPDRYGARYVRDQLGTLLPFSTAMAQMARATDPYAREARTTMDSLKARIPWLSQTLLPRNDIWGQPMANKDDLGMAGLTAISESRVNNDPVNLALLRLGIFPASPERKIVGVNLTDEQYDTFTRMAGRMAKMRLDALVGTAGFSALPDGVQSKVILGTIESSRQAARELTKMQNPQIIQQAMMNKRLVMTEGRAALTH